MLDLRSAIEFFLSKLICNDDPAKVNTNRKCFILNSNDFFFCLTQKLALTNNHMVVAGKNLIGKFPKSINQSPHLQIPPYWSIGWESSNPGAFCVLPTNHQSGRFGKTNNKIWKKMKNNGKKCGYTLDSPTFRAWNPMGCQFVANWCAFTFTANRPLPLFKNKGSKPKCYFAEYWGAPN